MLQPQHSTSHLEGGSSSTVQLRPVPKDLALSMLRTEASSHSPPPALLNLAPTRLSSIRMLLANTDDSSSDKLAAEQCCCDNRK